MKNKHKYQKPKITAKKIKVNFFVRDSYRSFDSFGNLMFGSEVYAQSWCLLPDNHVFLSNGNSKRVEEIKKGDVILRYNFDQKKIEETKVQEVIFHPKTPGGYVIINAKLKLSINHRLWINETSWERADNLRLNDFLTDIHGKRIAVRKLEKIDAVFDSYSIHVPDKHHNLFLENILIHE